jgi:NAD binding domain of 6-phosphogluconate dehydrogenase
MSCSCPAVRWQPCPDGTWIEMISTSPTAGKLLAEAAEARRTGVLDAPVGGGIRAAEAGTLQMFVGGDAERRNPFRQGTIRRTPRYREIPQIPAQTPGPAGLDAAKPRMPGTLATSPA